MLAKRIWLIALSLFAFAPTTGALTGCAPQGGENAFARAASVDFSIPSGEYGTDQVVHLTSATPEAAIYLTTDGTEPAAEARYRYTGPIPITGHGTQLEIRAFATVAGREPAPPSSAEYSIRYHAHVSNPTIAPRPGMYNFDQVVSLSSATEGAAIFYTLDGSAPDRDALRYERSFQLDGDGSAMTIRAVAYKTGMAPSEESSGTVMIDYAALNPPTVSPPGGMYATDQAVVLEAAHGATIRYTLDGTEPNAGSTVYTTPITIRGNEQSVEVKALAFREDKKPSSVTEAAFQIAYAAAATPNISLASGTYNGYQSVVLTSADEGASMFYTLDGTEPSERSTPYAGPIALQGPNDVKLRAIAARHDLVPSSVATADYNMTWNTASAVMMYPAGGSYSENQTVTLATTTPGATIYYAIVDESGEENRQLYTGPISIAGHGTNVAIRAQAIVESLLPGPIGLEQYTITWNAVSPPSISPGGSDYDDSDPPYVTLSSATAGADIRYRLEVEGELIGPYLPYDGPFELTRSATVRAYATRPGMLESPKNAESFRVVELLHVADGADPQDADGSESNPYDTIEAALAATRDTGDMEIRVAGGVYNPVAPLTFEARTSLVGGYDPASWDHDPDSFSTSIKSGASSAATLVAWRDGATRKTVLADVSLLAAPPEDDLTVVDAGDGSMTIRNIVIRQTGASQHALVGIHASGGAPHIRECQVTLDDAPEVAGLWLQGSSAPLVTNNVIDTNAEAVTFNFGIAFEGHGTFVGNTVRFGGGAIAVGIGHDPGQAFQAAPIIDNNMIWSGSTTGTRVCLALSEGHNTASLRGNNLFDCPDALLAPDGQPELVDIDDVNLVKNASGNQSFDLTDGANTFFIDEQSDWRLRDGGSVAFMALKSAGIDASEYFGAESFDFDGSFRTGDGEAGWTMGAYENDN